MKVLYFKIVFLGLLWSNVITAYSQDTLFLSLDSCQQWAKENYPLIKQYALIEKSKEYNISNANSFYFPQISLTGKATYQSSVPSINSSVFGPNVPFDFSYAVRKDQYQIQANIEQLIWQGVNSLKTQKDIARANAEIQTQQTNVSLYAIRNQINQIYLGILLLDKQLQQLQISKNTLQTTYKNMSFLYQNQMANMPDLDLIKAEIINLDQQGVQMQSMRTTYLNMLSYFIKQHLVDSTTVLTTPQISLDIEADTSVDNRPELAWYNAQMKVYDLQKKNININNSPRFSLYIQGGGGAPGFNYFTNRFMPYALGGLKLVWNFTGLFTAKNDKSLLDMQKNTVQVQKETFLFNTNVDIEKTMQEINKIKQLIQSDETIVKLRENVRKASDAKVQHGAMTSLDYIKMVNDERLAHQNKALHEIQLLISLYNLKFIRND